MNRSFALKDMFPIIKEQLDSGGSATFAIHGTSMLPMLKDRKDSVRIIKPKEQPKKYDIIFYRRKDGSFILHRIVKVKKGGYICRGDNQILNEFPVTEDMVIGVVEAYTRNNEWISVNSKRQYFYSRFKVNTILFLRTKRYLEAIINKLFGKGAIK
ncbi:MAG: S24/S26 family peptidase [Clostridia bacterium]|nr:S24/S26 family peptidase [Clostridia bacterium]